MTSRQATVLERIDELVTDLVRQLVLQNAAMQQPTPPSSLSSIESSGRSQTSNGDRPTKRARSAPRDKKAKMTPIKMLSFPKHGDQGRKESNISFPSSSPVRMRRFAQILRVLALVQTNLKRGTVVTNRDIFYQCMNLFRNQAASDRIVSQVVTLLGCSDRSEVNIVASPRGLVAGRLSIFPASQQEAIESRVGQARLIPTEITSNFARPQNDGWKLDLQCARERCTQIREHLVLVVEKEAVFKSLLQHQSTSSDGMDWVNVILVTAKGYPDHATRNLLDLISSFHCPFARVRVVGLFDADPYGVDIHRQFRLVSGGVEWIGVDLADFLNGGEALVQLRNDERATAIGLLRSPSIDADSRSRLTSMLLTGYKVEIEAAYDFGSHDGHQGGLVGYIENKLRTHTWRPTAG